MKPLSNANALSRLALYTPIRKPSVYSAIKFNKILFSFFLFLLITAQSLKAQQAVTEIGRYFGAGESTYPVNIKKVGGFTYIMSLTSSKYLPVTNGSTNKGFSDIYIAKLNSTGTIVFASYFGGSGFEDVNFYKNEMEIVGDDIYFTFTTISPDLPVTNGSVYKSSSDVAIVKINSVTGNLIFCSYYGGNEADDVEELKVDNGKVYVALKTESTDLPVTNSTTFKGANDLSFAKFDGNTGNIIWATYWGGNSTDRFAGMEISGNSIFFAGDSYSSNSSLPSTDGTQNQGGGDMFYCKIDVTNGNTNFLTYYGGTDTDASNGFKMIAGEVYIIGNTYSTDFPITVETATKGSINISVVKYKTDGTIAYSTMFGGKDGEYTRSFDVNAGSVYLATSTSSTNFPTTTGTVFAGIAESFGLPYDIAITKLNPSGNIVFSTFLGNVVNDAPKGIKVDCDDNVFVLANVGPGFPVTTGSNSGNSTAIIKINCTTGKLLFSKFLGTHGDSPRMVMIGNGVAEFVGETSDTGHPITLPPGTPNSSFRLSNDIYLARINTCPTGFTGNTAVSPSTQNVCSNGLVGIINMAPATLLGSAQPQQYINGIVNVPADISATRYQWQIAVTASGPWTDIPGANSQNYSPGNQTADRYYRRLAQSVCCGITTTTQTGDVAAVLISNVAPSVDAGGPFITCAGTSVTIGGSPTATPAAGNTITSYLWTPAGGYTPGDNNANPSVSPMVSTIYSVLVTDNLGCQQIGQTQVNVYAANAGLDKSSCANEIVRIGAAPLVGVPSVTYLWTALPADPTMSCTSCAQPDVHPTITTTYTLTMTFTSSNGTTCSTTDDVVVSVASAPINNGGAFGGDDVTICYGSTALLGTPDEAGFTYSWAPGNYLSENNVSQPTFQPGGLNFPNPNPFNFFVTAQKDGCIFVDSVKAFVIKADAGIDGCGPRLVGTPDGTPAISETYTWTKLTAGVGTSNFVGATNTAQVQVSGCTVPTTFQLTVTYNGTTCTDDVVVIPCGCIVPIVKVIAPFSCPSYSLNGGNVALVAYSSPDYTYTWSPAAGLSSTSGDTVYLTDNVARTYTVTATNKYDPTVFCTNTIDVNSPLATKPTFTAHDVTVCPGTGINIGQPTVAGYNYLWSLAFGLNSTTISNPIATVNSTTEYQVVVTDAGTGCTATDTATVTVYNLPSNVAGNNISLCGSGIAQLGVSSVPGVTYLWTPAAAYNPGNTSANPTVPVAATTTFFVTATNTAGGCTVNGSVTVTVNPAFAPFNFTDQTFCPGTAGALPLPAGPTGAGYTYSWSPAAMVTNPTSNGPTAMTLDPRPANTTTYTLTVADAAGCSNNANVTFTPTASIPDAGNDKTFCLSSGAVMLGNASAPTGGGITYSWSPATGLSSVAIPNPVFTPTVAGTFIYTITKTEGGCSTTDQVQVTVQDFTMTAMPAQTVCQNACTQIGITPQAGVSYLWTPASGLSNTTIANPIACPTATTTYRLTGTGINGCQATQDVLVRVVTDPSPTVTIPPIMTCLGSPAGARFYPVVSPAGSYSYLWSPSDGTLSDIYTQNPLIYPGSVGTKNYNLIIINQATGCGTNAPANVTIVNCLQVLPVKLENFSADIQDKNVLLKWEVSEEENLTQYEVQHSVNGITFSSIGNVTALGMRNYRFNHTSPVEGINFYRLKMISNKAESFYSSIRKVTISQQRGNLSVYPNPAKDEVNITLPPSLINKSATLYIYGFDGKLMKTVSLRSLGQTEIINTRLLPAGIYAVVVMSEKEIYNSKLIISR